MMYRSHEGYLTDLQFGWTNGIYSDGELASRDPTIGSVSTSSWCDSSAINLNNSPAFKTVTIDPHRTIRFVEVHYRK